MARASEPQEEEDEAVGGEKKEKKEQSGGSEERAAAQQEEGRGVAEEVVRDVVEAAMREPEVLVAASYGTSSCLLRY